MLGALEVGLGVAALTPLWDRWEVLVLAGLGALMITLVLEASDLRAGATPGEVVLWAALGGAFARGFEARAVAIGVAVLVGGLDLAGVGASREVTGGGGDPLVLDLGSAHVAAIAVAAQAAFTTWARRLGGRWPLTPLVLALALTAAEVREVQVVVVLAATFLALNLDRFLREPL